MNYIFFIIFLILTLVYLWNGQDFFNKKEWIMLILKVVGVLIFTALLGRLMHDFIVSWKIMPMASARHFTTALGLSLLTVLGMKFMVVMLCAIFKRIMVFHKKYNYESYNQLSSVSRSFSFPLLILAKCVISCGSVLMFYGIWLA